GGVVQFHISEPLYMQLAAHTTLGAFSIPGDPEFHPLPGDFSPVPASTTRTQIGALPRPSEFDPLRGIDVIGMPALKGKVVVMDNRGLNKYAPDPFDLDNAAVMNTFIYNPGTPFNAADAAEPQASINPGIPAVDRHIKLSYANFGNFATTSPGAISPSQEANPFIGRDPVRALDGIAQPDVPGITVGRGNKTSTGSFLLDTGAGASFISRAMASGIGVMYAPGRGPGDPMGTNPADPLLVDANGVAIEDQFSLTIAAFGADDPADSGDSSTIALSGFYLDFLLARTSEGNPLNDNDPNHFRFLRAPVLVHDITTSRLLNGQLQHITLDGIFGMNFLAASAVPPTSIFDPFITSPGAFDWIVYNDAESWIGMSMVPEPAAMSVLLLATPLYTRRRRCH
ncbi:MAG: hypothetical protein H7144_16415, partial [Burkholderiales bacterium]|nr:hypothetical protein [Phycisphaerae bacterium]